MIDRISEERRSWNMSRIKGRDTTPEVLVRKSLHRAGFRFRLNVRDLPGRPDIVLPKYRAVIFVNGCFWHRHEGCAKTTTPKSNVEFWQKKFSDTIARDRRNKRELETLGWQVITIWQCEIESNLDGLIKVVKRQLVTKKHENM